MRIPFWVLKVILGAAAFAAASLTGLPSAGAMKPLSVREVVERDIREDLRARRGTYFGDLAQRWEKKYGAETLSVLAALARDRALEDSDRYIALMSAVRLGGYGTASTFHDLLEDPSWLLRSGELKALKATGRRDSGMSPEIERKILKRLKDPALVVRAEAVEAVAELRPKGAIPALFAVLQDERNYPGGKALWVPRKALLALEEIGGPDCLPGRPAGRDRRISLGMSGGICRE